MRFFFSLLCKNSNAMKEEKRHICLSAEEVRLILENGFLNAGGRGRVIFLFVVDVLTLAVCLSSILLFNPGLQ